MPLIIGAKSATATGYAVDNSCRFNDDDGAYLSISPGSGSRLKATWSVWCKYSTQGHHIWGAYKDATHFLFMNFNSGGTFEFRSKDGGYVLELETDAEFRDPAAWYHVCCNIDTTQGTEANRAKIWINGVQQTSLSLSTYPAEDSEIEFNTSDYPTRIGDGTGAPERTAYDGYMAEFVFIDGTAYSASDFGEYDSDSPTIWKPKDPSELTFGTNGFYLDFEDSADLGADVSGNSNDFTENNLDATDQATDTPTNNFSTFNPLNIPITAAPTFSEGNCEVVSQVGSTLNFGGTSTICVSAGKWYWECSPVSVSNSSVIGVTGRPATDAYLNDPPGHDSDSYGYVNNGEKLTSNSGSSYGDTYTDGDIIGVALDITNLKIYFAKNGTWQDSGDPTSGASGTGAAFTITAPASTTEGIYAFSAADWGNGATTFQANFGGCPAFTVSSAAADGNGYGAFEYAPPSGYYALCTKNLAEYG